MNYSRYHEAQPHLAPRPQPAAQNPWLENFVPAGLADWSQSRALTDESEAELLERQAREAAEIETRLSRAEARRLLGERIWRERDELCRARVQRCEQALEAARYPGLAALLADQVRGLEEAERLQQAWDQAVQQEEQARVALHLAPAEARPWLQRLIQDAGRCALLVAEAMQELQAAQDQGESEIARLRAHPLGASEPAVLAAGLALEAARERHADFCGEDGHYTRRRRQAQQALAQLRQARDVMRARHQRELLQLAAARFGSYGTQSAAWHRPEPASSHGQALALLRRESEASRGADPSPL